MKIARFRAADGNVHVGKIIGTTAYELTPHCATTECLGKLLAEDSNAFERLAAIPQQQLKAHALGDIRLLAPVTAPSKFLAIGLNYQSHAEESQRIGVAPATSQIWFNKQVSCIAGPGDAIERPEVVEQLDYEAELGLLIGKTGRNISRESALDH